MKKHICPVCDQIMASSHYCRMCKRIVRNPKIQEVNYYLNERHSQSETDCTYHLPVEKKQIPAWNMPKPASPPKKKSQYSGVATVIGVSVILAFMFYIINTDQKAVKEYDMDMGKYQGEALEYWVLTDEEARDTGTSCNGQFHFEVEKDELKAGIDNLLEQRGYEISDLTTSSYNEEYADGSTWYSAWIDIAYENLEGAGGILWIDSDTATQKVHEVYLATDNPEEGIALAAAIVSLRGEERALFGEGTIPDSMEEELISIADNGEFNWENVKLSIQGEYYEGEYFITIRPVQ